MRYIFTLLFLLSSFGFAEDEIDLSYLKAPKTDDPNTLYVVTSIGKECETSKKQLDKIVRGSLIRSRIKPVDEYTEPMINVQLRCLNLKNNNPAYEVTTRFGYYDYDRKIAVFFGYNYNSLGIGNKQYIETAVKDSVDKAMVEYIQANFMDD